MLELDAAGNVVRRFVRGDGADEVLLEYVGSSLTAPRYHHLDERGSDIAWSDGTGAGASISTYDEFGTPTSTNPGRFQYTGQMWLKEIGVHYYKARVMNPRLGVFHQVDPAGHDDETNGYVYVGNDPLNWVDPLGLDGDTPAVPQPLGPAECMWTGSCNAVITGDWETGFTVTATRLAYIGDSMNPFFLVISQPSNGFSGENSGGGDFPEGPCTLTGKCEPGEWPKLQPAGEPPSQCPTLARIGNDISSVGSSIQKVGIGIEVAGLTAAAFGIVVPPSELGAAGLIGLGGVVIIAGTVVQAYGSAIRFAATGNYVNLGLDFGSLLAGRISSRGRAQDIARGTTLDEAVSRAEQLNGNC